jgi:hypothetical protein
MASASTIAAPKAAATAAPKASSTAVPAFRTAVNAAMRAAQLSQTAKTPSDWQAIVQSWELAIAQMKAVPASDSNAAIAQRKAVEYSKNLAYARRNASNAAAKPAKPIAVTAARPGQSVSAKQRIVVQQATPPRDAWNLLQLPLLGLQTNPWLGKGAIVLLASGGLVALLTLEVKPSRARAKSSRGASRGAQSGPRFFDNLGNGLSGLLAQLGNVPLQPSPMPLKSDKVQRKLFRKLVALTQDEATAVRLIKGYLQRHPEHSMDWCCEKAISDLQQSA